MQVIALRLPWVRPSIGKGWCMALCVSPVSDAAPNPQARSSLEVHHRPAISTPDPHRFLVIMSEQTPCAS